MTREIMNTQDQLVADGGGFAILRSYSETRDRYFTGWAVYCIDASGEEVETDPKAHWTKYGRKHFSTFGSSRPNDRGAEALKEAIAWVKYKGWYSGQWKRNGAWDYVPEGVNRRFPIRLRCSSTQSSK